jgi:type VII secretion-associated serine protease mycosin
MRAAVVLVCAAAFGLLPSNPARADHVRDSQWHLRFLNIEQAHKISQGGGVTVAVIDSGVYPHQDLRNNLLVGTSLLAAGSGDGRRDMDGHGTAMAGIIAAHGRGTETGVLGIAPQAWILPIRDKSDAETGGADVVARGIDFAVTRGARVINVSSGGDTSLALLRAVDRARAADVVVVASAGNLPQDRIITSPAIHDGVVAVGASNRAGNRATVSAKGTKLALLAPGVDIQSTGLGGKYQRSNGTSNAAAIVAGAAALVRSRFPELSAEEVVHRLTATAIDKGPPGRDDEYGYGVLNIVGALTADVPPLASASPSVTAATSSEADPSLVAATPMPGDPGGGRGTPVFLAVGVLVVAGLVVTLLLLRARRPPPDGQV